MSAIIGAGQAGWRRVAPQAGRRRSRRARGRACRRDLAHATVGLIPPGPPNRFVRLPGAEYDGPEPDGFISLAELIDHLQSWANSFSTRPSRKAPGSRASMRTAEAFRLSLPSGTVKARSVVVASGAYQRPHRPNGAENAPKGVVQLSPRSTPPGGPASGCGPRRGERPDRVQLAEEIHLSGRKVFLACGRCVWIPRRLHGHDMVWWLIESGYMDRTPDKLPSPPGQVPRQPAGDRAPRRARPPLPRAPRHGVELLGRYAGAEGTKIQFADDLAFQRGLRRCPAGRHAEVHRGLLREQRNHSAHV